MKSFVLLYLILFSFATYSAEILFTSHQEGQVYQDGNGRINLLGRIDFSVEDNPTGNLGKISCNGKEAQVQSGNHQWTLNYFEIFPGNNAINCSYTWKNVTVTKTLNLVWEITAEMFIDSPIDGFRLRHSQGRFNLGGHVLFQNPQDVSGNLGKVTCNGKQGQVQSGSHLWSINSFLLPHEGHHLIECSYTWNGKTTQKSINVFWSKNNFPPEAKFSMTPEGGTAPLVVEFDASESSDADGGIVSYSWVFGDGQVASGENVSHTFHTAGTYQVILTLTDNEGGVSSLAKNLIVNTSENQAPIAMISANPQLGEAPLNVTFDGSLSHDPDGTVASYVIDFGDGTPIQQSVIPYFNHQYTSVGLYTATLKVIDNQGASSSNVITNIEVMSMNLPPVAVISSDVSSGQSPLLVNFSAEDSYDTDGQIIKYQWTFPDSTIKEGMNISHVLTGTGPQTIFLTVFDDKNVPATSSIVIELTADEDLPTLAILPEDGSLIRTSTPIFEIIHTDATSGINLSTLKAYLNGIDLSNRLNTAEERSFLSFTEENPISQGNYELRIEVQDNSGNLSVLVHQYKVDLGILSSAYIVGKVLHEDGTPLVGVQVNEVGAPFGVKISNQTDEEGKFKVPFNVAGIYKLSFNKSGFIETVRTINPVIIEDIDMKIIKLAESDPVSIPVVASVGGQVENSTGTLKVTFNPGDLPHDIVFTAREFTDQETMPGPLPPQSVFTYAWDMRPQGINFNNGGVELLLDNHLGFPVGAEIVYGIFDRDLGRWLDSGRSMTIIATDKTKNGTAGVLKEPFFVVGDPNIPFLCSADGSCSPPITISGGGNGGPCPFPPPIGGCEIDQYSGDLSVNHETPAIISGGENHSLNFRYHSTTAYPHFFTSTEMNTRNPDSADYVESVISIAGKTHRARFDGEAVLRPTAYRTSIEAKNAIGEDLASGIYTASNVMTIAYSNSEYATATYFGGPPRARLGVVARVPVTFRNETFEDVTILNRKLSPFGTGWSIEGFERLHISQSGKVLRDIGTHRPIRYNPTALVPDLEEKKFYNKKITGDIQIDSLNAFDGVVYATDCRNNFIYRISPSGDLDIVAGNGERGFSGDGGFATAAKLNCPIAVTRAETGGFYFADRDNYRIRRVYRDGTIKTLAHHNKKPLSVSEDKMRAVFFTTESEVMLITPRGALETFSAKNKGYLPVEVKNPSQVYFNMEEFPIVLDKDNGRIINLFPQNQSFTTLFGKGSQAKTNESGNIKPKSVSYDPVSHLYYLLDDQGKIYHWDGKGTLELTELAFVGSSLKQKSFHKAETNKVSAMTYSPETGIVLISDNQFFMKKKNKTVKDSTVSYIVQDGYSGELVKLSNGTFEITESDKVKKVFNSNGYLTAIIRPDGKNTFYQYNSSNLLKEVQGFGGVKFLFTYDGSGYLKSLRDSSGRETRFDVDEKGHLLRIEGPDGTFKEFSYDVNGLLTSERKEDGEFTEFNYVENRLTSEVLSGNRERFFTSFTSIGLFADQKGSATLPPVTTDMVESVSDWSKSGDCKTRSRIDRVSGLTLYKDCLNGMASYEKTNGMITSEVTAAGRTYRWAYDQEQRLIASVDQNGTTYYQYDNETGKVKKTIDPLNHEINITYNSLSLPATITDQLGNTSSYTYDSFGQVTSYKDALNNETNLAYDENHNLMSITDPLGNTVEFTRDSAGNISSNKDPLNRVTTFSYDSMNRVTEILAPLNYNTSLTYTPSGKIKTLTDANNATTIWDYDPISTNVSKMTNPQGEHESFVYDLNNQLSTKTRKDGSQISFTYDLKGRLILKSTSSESFSYGYDADDLLTLSSSATSTQLYGYNEVGILNYISSSDIAGQIGMGHDSRGLRSSFSFMAGSNVLMEVSYDYDPRKLLTGMVANLGGRTIQWQRYWDEVGRPETDIYSNGIKVQRSYDAAGRLTYLSNEYASGEPLSRFELSYNPTGTIKEILKTFIRPDQPTSGKYTLKYEYDDLDRLVFATTDGNFSYDVMGNHTNKGQSHNIINQILEDSDYTYSYTDNGDLSLKVSKLTGDKIEYSWGSFGELNQVVVKKSNNTIKSQINYVYDALNRRISRSVNGQITKYAYDGEDIIAEFDGDNKVKALYLHGPGVDEPIAMVRDLNNNNEFEENELFFYSKDHLNSIHDLTDYQGKPVQRYNYTAYGETKLEHTSSEERDKFIASPYGYTSREWEQETGDYYYRARYYDPKSGRFLSEDPIGFDSGDMSHYRYVGNNPIYYNDPSGEIILAPILIGGIMGGGIDLISQLLMNGGDFNCIDWKSIGVSTGLGMLGGISGPGGALFGRMKYGARSYLNSGNFRIGWSWNDVFKRNFWGIHGGKPKTPSHWHLTPIPGPSGPASNVFPYVGGALGGIGGSFLGSGGNQACGCK